jgi:hypothetical protein
MTGIVKKNLKSLINVEINVDRARDTGMAFVLILLLLELFIGSGIYFKISIPVLILNMIAPQIFYPIAYIWFGLAQMLGTIVSKILLFVVFSIIVLPVALLRRLLGKDTLLLKKWNTNSDSVFKTRDHLFSSSDIEKPY